MNNFCFLCSVQNVEFKKFKVMTPNFKHKTVCICSDCFNEFDGTEEEFHKCLQDDFQDSYKTGKGY